MQVHIIIKENKKYVDLTAFCNLHKDKSTSALLRDAWKPVQSLFCIKLSPSYCKENYNYNIAATHLFILKKMFYALVVLKFNITDLSTLQYINYNQLNSNMDIEQIIDDITSAAVHQAQTQSTTSITQIFEQPKPVQHIDKQKGPKLLALKAIKRNQRKEELKKFNFITSTKFVSVRSATTMRHYVIADLDTVEARKLI